MRYYTVTIILKRNEQNCTTSYVIFYVAAARDIRMRDHVLTLGREVCRIGKMATPQLVLNVVFLALHFSVVRGEGAYSSIPFLFVEGTHYDIGHQIVRCCMD